MNKYQEAYTLECEHRYIIESILDKYPEIQMKITCDKKYEKIIEKIKSFKNKYKRLPCKVIQELLNQTKIPTLEKVKKEWKDLGYEWIEELYTDSIVLRKTVEESWVTIGTHTITYFISINVVDKTYRAEKRSCFACEGMILTLQEHQLITKTIQALGESNGN